MNDLIAHLMNKVRAYAGERDKPNAQGQSPFTPEGSFQSGIRATPWFGEFKQKHGEEPNLNDPNYDYRAAWKAGARPDVRDAGDGLLHWPSQFKGPNHPNRFVGGMDTITGQPQPAQPPNFDLMGMFNPEAIASQRQPGMQRQQPFPLADAMAGHSAPAGPMAAPPRPQMAQPQPQAAPMPMPQPRPQQAPQEMGFFQRNAAMMQDPLTGMFIDPGAAAQAQASSGAIIPKMLAMLQQKANR